MTTRRHILIVPWACMLAMPLAAVAQQKGKIWRIGFLSTTSVQQLSGIDVNGAFLQGMRDLGYVEGKNFVMEWRYGEGKPERLAELAAELIRLAVDVLVTRGTPAGQAAQRATATVPIVIGATADPVGDGFAKSLARPGGNITGLSTGAGEVVPKHLELLMTAVPGLSRIAVLHNPINAAHPGMLRTLQAAAQTTAVKIQGVEAGTPQEIERAFSLLLRERAQALIVIIDALFIQQHRRIAELAIKHRLPSVYATREYPEGGGLMSYGLNLADNYRRAATYVDKILKGAKPGELPFEQPTRFELVINMKTAKALGITIPQSILVRADRVIE